LIALFDEGAALFGQLGLHSGNKEYDKALYNTLWSTPPFMTYDTKTYQLRSEDPRFNMGFATHPDTTHKLLNSNYFIIFLILIFNNP
jgi:hypothetical protein